MLCAIIKKNDVMLSNANAAFVTCKNIKYGLFTVFP